MAKKLIDFLEDCDPAVFSGEGDRTFYRLHKFRKPKDDPAGNKDDVFQATNVDHASLPTHEIGEDVELDEKWTEAALVEAVFGADRYEWRKYEHDAGHPLHYRGKHAWTLRKGDTFGIRSATSSKNTHRIVIPHMGETRVMSVPSDEGYKLMRKSSRHHELHDVLRMRRESVELDEKNWIAGAIKRPGALTRKARRAGESPMELARDHEHDPGRTGRQARFALELRKFNKKD